jgi:hypothetical protein
MWRKSNTNIFVNIFDHLEVLARSATNVDFTTKRMKMKVFIGGVVLTEAVNEARIRAQQEYLARHPKGLCLDKC